MSYFEINKQTNFVAPRLFRISSRNLDRNCQNVFAQVLTQPVSISDPLSYYPTVIIMLTARSLFYPEEKHSKSNYIPLIFQKILCKNMLLEVGGGGSQASEVFPLLRFHEGDPGLPVPLRRRTVFVGDSYIVIRVIIHLSQVGRQGGQRCIPAAVSPVAGLGRSCLAQWRGWRREGAAALRGGRRKGGGGLE